MYTGNVTGRSPSLASHFANHVEVTIENVSDLYPASEAATLLQRFLSQEANWRYAEVHSGKVNDSSGFSIVYLTGSTGQFRVHIYYKYRAGTFAIQTLTFDRM